MLHHLPNFAPPTDQNDRLEQHKSITLSEAYKSKIEFALTDSNDLMEVGKIVKPYIYVRIPGTKKYEAKKLTEFKQVRIGNEIYNLEK